ncbi:MAG: hypothetical protein GY816_06770 [Cytophagales bacterium]|nr:hypothetical protein [Cytophagales bacterium]
MKKLSLAVLAFCVVSMASAQYKSGGGGGDKIYFGGGFGLSFGTGSTSISASPIVGYKITDEFSAGVGITYQYLKYKVPDAQFNNFGGSLFSRYQFTNKYFAHIEYERLSFEYPTGYLTPDGDVESARGTNDAFFVGGGYRESLSRNSSFSLTILYDLLYDEELSPYASPLNVRAGVAVGF